MAESKTPKFDRAFAAARKEFKKTGDANDYTFYFKGEGREGRFTVNQKGETKKDLMAKFAPGSKNTGANYKVRGDANVRPKLRPKSNTVVSEKEPAVILESFVKTKIAPELSAVMAKLEEKLKGARSKAEARKILQENTSKAFSPSTMNAMLKKLEETGMFKFKPAQPKRTPPIKKTAPKKDVAKPNKKVIQTKKRVITNAAIKKFMRKEFPERLSNIEIGDTVFFRTNAAGEPVVASILKKGK